MAKDEKSEARKEIKRILIDLDNVAEKSKFLHQIVDEYQKVRDLYHNELKDKKNAGKMQTIMDVLNFVIKDGKLGEMMSGTTGDGKLWKYPAVDSFDDKT